MGYNTNTDSAQKALDEILFESQPIGFARRNTSRPGLVGILLAGLHAGRRPDRWLCDRWLG